MKKLITVVFALSFVVIAAFPSFASDIRVIDNANLLSSGEIENLESRISEISTKYNFDILILTENGIGGVEIEPYAQDYFDYNGYGYGDTHDGIIFAIDMDSRQWGIVTTGYGMTAFTDYGTDLIGEAALSDLSDGYYSSAFNTFLDYTDKFLEQAEIGEPFDINNTYRDAWDYIVMVGISLLFGIALAAVIMMILKGQLKTKVKQAAANQYIRQNSFNLYDNRDFFLYSNVTKTKRATESSGGSGGTTSSTGSSGTSHGGSSGRF